MVKHSLRAAVLVAALWWVPGPLPGGTNAVEAAPRRRAKEVTPAEALGWRLGTQAYTFRKFTFFEAVDKAASMGLGYIEAYPGQRLSREKPDVRMGPGLTAAIRREVKEKLGAAGVRLVCFGVTGAGNEAGWRRLFEFCRDMGVETITSEPDPAQMDVIEKLCEEFGINLAIHNHPKPSRYWNPDKVLEAIEGRGKRIGSCADTGHWNRSGLVPIECLKKLDGRVVSLHFKDLDRKGGGHDVPWGTGVCDVRGMLAELERQGFKGVFSIEYEHNWDDSMPEIRKCIEYFHLVAGEIYRARRERERKKTTASRHGARRRPPAPKDEEDEAEAAAGRLYRMARQAERMAQRDAAASLYSKIVDEYPDTAAAKRAAERLRVFGR